MRHSARLIVLLAILAPGPLGAQWRIGLDLGVEQVGRFIRPSPGEEPGSPDGRPTQGWPLALRVERGGAGIRTALAVSRTSPGLELFGSDLTVALRPGFEVLMVTPELSHRLISLNGGGQVRASLAVPLERWSFPTYSDPPRWRAGLAAGASAEFPLSARLSGRVAAALGAVFRNPLTDTEVTEGYETTAMRRRSLKLGVQWRL